MTIDELKRDAMQLDPARRLSFARELLQSVDGQLEVDSDQLWVEEAARRQAALVAGQAHSLPAGDVLTGAPVSADRPILFHPAGARELHEAAENTELQGPGMGAVFIVDALSSIESLPVQAASVAGSAGKVRIQALAQFPIELLYVAGEDEIIVLAVAYYLREPVAPVAVSSYPERSFETKVVRTADGMPETSRWRWMRAPKTTLHVTGEGLSAGDIAIPSSEIESAELLQVPDGLVLVVQHAGAYHQFSLHPDPFWDGELPFAVEREDVSAEVVRQRRTSLVLLAGGVVDVALLAYAVLRMSPVTGIVTLLWATGMGVVGFLGYQHTRRARAFLGATYGFGTGVVIAFLATSAGTLHLPSFSGQAVLFMQWWLGALVCGLGVLAALILWLSTRRWPRYAERASLWRGAMLALLFSTGIMGLVAASLLGQVR